MIKSIKDTVLSHRTIFLRCDLNVPMKDGSISDDSRILASINTIKYLLSIGAKIVISSHLGRPDGRVVDSMSLLPVCKKLEQILDHDITFLSDILSENSIEKVKNATYPSLFMLENLRFHQGEEDGSEEFAKQLALYGDVFVNDAFACSHRKHASVFTIAKFLPSFAGLNLQHEIISIDNVLSRNTEKLVCIVGGSKVSSKIKLLENLVTKSTAICLGGGIANTFLVAKGYDIGGSMFEKNCVDVALNIIKLANENNCELVLPDDFVISKSISKSVSSKICNLKNIKENKLEFDDQIVDIGARSLQKITEIIDNCSSVIWNGPLGVFENHPFDAGSIMVARYIAHQTSIGKIKSIVGGGDAVACVNIAGLGNEFSFVSTAGGAFLEYLEANTLPCIEVLKH